MATQDIIKSKYEQLETINADLMAELEKLSSENLFFKPDENSWNIMQVLDHVKNAEVGTLRYIRKKMKYGGVKKTNWSAKIRASLMRMVNNSSVRFKMPSVLPQPEASDSLETVQKEWQALRVEWKDYLESFPQEYLDKAVFKHPIFGRLSLSQAVDSMISHQNHHIKQIRRIKKRLA